MIRQLNIDRLKIPARPASIRALRKGFFELLCDSDDATGETSASIAGRLSFQIIGFFVHDNRVTDN